MLIKNGRFIDALACFLGKHLRTGLLGPFLLGNKAIPKNLSGVVKIGERTQIESGTMTTRRFPSPWTVEQTPGGYKVRDANGQSLAYVCGRETRADADTANVLTMDEAAH